MGFEGKVGEGFDQMQVERCGSQSVTHLDVLAVVVAS